MSRLQLRTLPLFAILAVLPWGLVAAPKSEEAPTPEQQMLQSSTKAYQAATLEYQSGNATNEDVYLWSKRWMEAETRNASTAAERLKAAKNHLDRLQSQHTRIATLHETGSRGGSEFEFQASNFYVAEAEFLLSQANAGN